MQLFLFSSLSIAVINTIPKPNGTYGVNLSTMKLTDPSRLDPFAPTRQTRSVMISVFYPVSSASHCQTILSDYMPPATAAVEDLAYSQYGVPNGTFESLRLSLCTPPGPQKDSNNLPQQFPLLLFSPGLGNSRLLYNALAQSIASYGYTVVTVDHPYDANVVEYPDGSLVPGANISTTPQIDLDVATRAQDLSFVLDALGNPCTLQTLFQSTSNPLNTNRVGTFGHSLGGATAASAMFNDSRIACGANLDGTFFGAPTTPAFHLTDPFLLFGHDGKNQSSDPTWAQVWPRLRGWTLELALTGAQHATFEDLPLLLQVLGLEGALPPEVVGLVGSLGGGRAVQVITAYLVAFFDAVLKCEMGPLPQGPSGAFPEVQFVAVGEGA